MIPVRLKLNNFMCYRDGVPPLEFAGLHTACICGNNGNGKSALIDAMTWALWGETRARSDEELVYSGQTDMDVEFDFAISGQLYRILRKYSRPKKRQRSGQTILELQAATAEGSFRTITGDTILQTQQKIGDILHMDYDTFINSAYLRQGRADEFTRQTAAKRKEVLSTILGLSLYDNLEEKAREKAREKEMEKAQLEAGIREIDLETAGKPAGQAVLEAAAAELSRIEASAAGHEQKLKQLRQEKEARESQKLQLVQLDEHIRDNTGVLDKWREQVKQHTDRIKEYEDLLGQRSAIETGYDRLTETRKLCQSFNLKFRHLAALKERQHNLDLAVTRAGQSVLAEHQVTLSRIAQLEDTARKLPSLRRELEELSSSGADLARLEANMENTEKAGQELRAEILRLESELARGQTDLAEIDEKAKLLTGDEAKCPVCETELNGEKRQALAEKYAREKQNKMPSLAAARAALAGRKQELLAREKETSHLKTRLNQDRASFQSRSSLLNREIVQGEEASRKLVDENKILAEIEQRLARRDFAAVEQAALARLEEEIAALDYDSAKHEQAGKLQDSLEQYEGPKRHLEEAERLVGPEKVDLSQAEQAVRERMQSLEAAQKKRAELASGLGLLPGLLADLDRAEAEYRQMLAAQKQTQERVNIAATRLQRYAELETKRREKSDRLAEAGREEGIFKDLARAFGKGGIQAQLIESVLPEIENEANRLLARMTDNRMHVKFETQRETKKGDIIETLDILISDELGTRSYEMFSGGEAFRINFAIRIALSRLLSHRAGAPLSTLIVDEGFGTQDSAGIERLKEAINSVQDDFEKILVITHIDDVKDAFPSRIDVIKTADGSTIEVN